jgi:hypothetical protein
MVDVGDDAKVAGVLDGHEKRATINERREWVNAVMQIDRRIRN